MPKKGEEESGMPHRGKSIAKRHTTKRVEKHSQRGKYLKKGQENLQNAKRSIDEYWGRKTRYA